VPEGIARGIAEATLAAGVDLAVSLDMQVDHGTVQPMELMFGNITARPFVPVFINSVAPPFAPIARVRALGEAVGAYLTGLDAKVLLISSGGLSHDPPVPRLATASPEQRRMLLGRVGDPTPEARAARQQRVIDVARDFAAGTSTIQDLAPDWDRCVMAILASGDLTPFDGWDPTEMTRVAGNSSHEIRTWIAGYAALGSAGSYTVQHSYYRPLRELIAGFGLTTVTTNR
jgi:2,3-dihydroxyphenylpropionate 1,2-dioxygenase